ncbi:MAG: response regulator transcription factor [Herbinix sp.]|jgi:DNA-binding response OmpR family regulator|nr:response regulator transcription factor [Herbinix sp.]
MTNQILLVEDDLKLQEIVSDYFISKGCDITCVSGGIDAMNVISQHEFHLILLDIMLPRGNGYDVCKEIRKTRDIPIIFVTAKSEEEDQLNGFSLGADDYVIKPFSLPVLYAKVIALINRTHGQVLSPNVKVGNIEVDINQRILYIHNKKVVVPPKEYDLLLFLIMNKTRIFTREQLLIRFWGYDFDGSDRVVDSHIKKLRKALGPCASYIKTILKVGYKLEVANYEEV